MKLVAQTARRTNVLYVATDGREAKLAKGAFDKSHPHLTLEFTTDVHEARRHLKENGGCDALLIGWSVPEADALALIAHVRQQALPMAVIAAGEQALERYAQAGADECVARGASFLARLPDAIDGAVAKRQTAAGGGTDAADGPKPLRIAYAGDIQFLKGALGADRTQLQVTPLAEVLTEAANRRVSLDAVVIDHSARDAATGTALADVKRVELDVPVVLLVDPQDETSALRTFDGSLDECLVKTPGWTHRLTLRLAAVCTRFAQAQELASLRSRESRLRTLVDRLPACVVRVSPDGAILAMNAVALDLVGAAEPRQVLRKAFQALVGPLEIESCTEFIRRVAEGEQRSIELPLTTLTGVGRTVAATAVPMPPEEGRPGSVLMVLRDITERVKLETALEQAPAPIVIEHSQAVSVTLSDPAPAPALALADPTPAPALAVAEPVPAAPPVDPAQLRNMEATLARICGQARSSFQALEDGLHEAETQHDATLARQQETYARLEAAHRERWQTYDRFVDGAALGIFQIDGDGRIVDANAALAQALAYDSPSGVVAAAHDIAALTEPASWAHAVTTWHEAAPASAVVDTRWKRRDGTLATLRLTGRRRPSTDAGETRIEVVAENLSAQRALEAQVRRGRRWEDVARLTTGLASDLRSAVEDLHEPARGTTLEAAVARATDLSRQLVALGRRGARAAEPLDVNAVVGGVEGVMRRLVDEHIELTLDLAPSLELVEGERPVLEEALVNLAVAAGDTLPAGGRVCIATASVEIGAATGGIPAPGDYVAVSLTTQGWGAATAGSDQSTGVATARRAIGRLGGSLTVDAVSDESLTFRVYLPQASVAILTDDAQSAAGEVAARA
ncbi:MAG TPA: PAS domain-containing protein [Vicinamibacterales bacterium]|jgi:PAS domain S-box-containing protein|nr:PAS domain-containing protein [Vicinamibacterales bacterium]